VRAVQEEGPGEAGEGGEVRDRAYDVPDDPAALERVAYGGQVGGGMAQFKSESVRLPMAEAI
jgi:hypothetical protein